MFRRILTGLLLLPTLFLGGCSEKGCTDPKAVNYNSTATDDDGTCITCQQSQSVGGNKTAPLVDTYSGSPHYMQTVVMFHVRQLNTEYNNGLCGSKTCDMEISVQSLVNQNMSLNYQINCSGDIYFNVYRAVTLSPMATVVTDTLPSNQVSNPCGNLDLCNLFVNTSGIISYW